MSFHHYADGTIEIQGQKFDLELFLEVEPEYALPEGVVAQEYKPNKHHILYTGENQISGIMPWKEGNRYINRLHDLILLKKTNKQDENYTLSVPSNPPKEELDPNAYTVHELVMTMWEHIFGGIDNTDKAKELSRKIGVQNETNL